jgi:hypothetical protein
VLLAILGKWVLMRKQVQRRLEALGFRLQSAFFRRTVRAASMWRFCRVRRNVGQVGVNGMAFAGVRGRLPAASTVLCAEPSSAHSR